MNQLMILLQMMTVAGIPSFSSFTDIILPDSGAVQKREVPGPSMDYDDYEDEEGDYDDYDDYDYDSDDFETKKSGRLRQQIKSCEFIDLTALGPICNTGYKIKYYKEKIKPRPKHTIFWDGLTGNTILAVHSGKQWQCCTTRTNVTMAVAATCTRGRGCPAYRNNYKNKNKNNKTKN